MNAIKEVKNVLIIYVDSIIDDNFVTAIAKWIEKHPNFNIASKLQKKNYDMLLLKSGES